MSVRQRRTIRRFVRVPCSVVRERDFVPLGERTVDLSSDGMQIVTEARVLTGEPVMISFQIPATREWFDAQGYVARVVHGRRPGDRGRCLGIEFADAQPRMRALLAAILKRLPQPLAQRRVIV